MAGGRAAEGGLVVDGVCAALNARDVEALVACFHDDYRSEQPAHPDRAFGGREQVRENWSAIFAGVPDFAAELVGASAAGDVEWSEWRWRGTHADGTRLDMAGVIVAGVREGRLAWARLYVEPVEQGGAGIRAAVRGMSGGDAES
jgi:ketosteroid isomerase-like protein